MVVVSPEDERSEYKNKSDGYLRFRNLNQGIIIRNTNSERNYYCQKCAKFIPRRFLFREEKTFGRLRCKCCHGLVRNKFKLLALKQKTNRQRSSIIC